MPELAETLLRGSANLDQMKLDTRNLISLVCKGYTDLNLGSSTQSYFLARDERDETLWDFRAQKTLDIRCISYHPSVCLMVPSIIFTTDQKWLQKGVGRHLSGDYYALELGMKGVQIAYEALDLMLEKVFIRWSSLRSHLQPMITAGQMS